MLTNASARWIPRPAATKSDLAAPDGKAWKLRLLVAAARRNCCRARPSEQARSRRVAGAPAVAGQQDTNATVTALANSPGARALLSGPLPRLRGPPAGARGSGRSAELAASELGTQVHALLAGTPPPNPAPEALRLAKVFSQSALGRRVERAARVEREFDFLMAVDDLVIRGQVDLWFEEGGELAIVDYKTDAVSADGSSPARAGLCVAVAAVRPGGRARGRPRARSRLAAFSAPEHGGGSGPDAVAARFARASGAGIRGGAERAGVSPAGRRALQAVRVFPGTVPGGGRVRGHYDIRTLQIFHATIGRVTTS